MGEPARTLVGRWARRSARSPSPWVRYPGRRRQSAVVGMGRSGNAQLARGYLSYPRRVQSDRSFRATDRTCLPAASRGLAAHTWVPTYLLLTPAMRAHLHTLCPQPPFPHSAGFIFLVECGRTTPASAPGLHCSCNAEAVGQLVVRDAIDTRHPARATHFLFNLFHGNAATSHRSRRVLAFAHICAGTLSRASDIHLVRCIA